MLLSRLSEALESKLDELPLLRSPFCTDGSARISRISWIADSSSSSSLSPRRSELSRRALPTSWLMKSNAVRPLAEACSDDAPYDSSKRTMSLCRLAVAHISADHPAATTPVLDAA